MKLEITKERVLKAAEKCGDAKNILKELFPDVFKCSAKNKYFMANSRADDFKGGIVLGTGKGYNSTTFEGIVIRNTSGSHHILGECSDSWNINCFDEIKNPFK